MIWKGVEYFKVWRNEGGGGLVEGAEPPCYVQKGVVLAEGFAFMCRSRGTFWHGLNITVDEQTGR